MLTEWRLIVDDIHEARYHFAVEEALARLVDAGNRQPVIRLRRVRPSVFIGVHQNTWKEIDVDYCQEHEIQIVRRMNGGGAVYHEMGSFCFSAFFERKIFNKSDTELYLLFAEPVIRTCADYGVDAHFRWRNDVLVGNRKIFGSAHFSWYQAHVQSGTFLVNMNFDAMEKALTPSAEKFAEKSTTTIRERVTSLSEEVGRELDTCEVMSRFSEHLAEVLAVKLVPRELTEEELALAKELLETKYNTDHWNFGKQLEFQMTVAERVEEGVISLSVDLAGEIIQRAKFFGDLLIDIQQELTSIENLIQGCKIQKAIEIVKSSQFSEKFLPVVIQLLEKVEDQAGITVGVKKGARS